MKKQLTENVLTDRLLGEELNYVAAGKNSDWEPGCPNCSSENIIYVSDLHMYYCFDCHTTWEAR